MGSTEMMPNIHHSGRTAPKSSYASSSTRPANFFGINFSLRLLLFASSISGLVVLVTSKEIELVLTGLPPPFPLAIPRAAEFKKSPAFLYQLVALAVSCLYSNLTIITSCFLISHPSPSTKMLFLLIFFDTLTAGVMASATGASGAMVYIGLKGNNHIGWVKICSFYGKFCRHIGSSVAVTLVGSIVLVMLVVLSSYSLYRRSR